MRITVTRVYDKANSAEWGFHLFNTTLVLDSYRFLLKETPRHKAKTVSYYDRLRQRDSSIKEHEVPLPEDVKSEAVEILKSKFGAVKTWYEYKN